MKKILNVFIAAVVLISCSSYPEKVKEVEDLIVRAESMRAKLDSTDEVDLKHLSEQTQNIIRKFKRHLKSEWLTEKQSVYDLSSYRALKKPLKNLSATQESLEKEIPHRIQQLNDLKHDIVNDHFESVEAINDAIFDETERLNIAEENLNTLIDKLPGLIEIRSRYQVFIDSLDQKINEVLEIDE